MVTLAAYAQDRPLAAPEATKLGLDDDQLRLLLVSRGNERPVVRATSRGKPATDIAVELFRKADEEPTELRTDGNGEIPCPDLKGGPVSLLAVLGEHKPGTRDGRDFSHTRFKATLAIAADVTDAAPDSSPEECLARVADVHGAAGPWAVAGYRIGACALR